MNSVTRSIKHIAVIFTLVACFICLPLMMQNAYAAEEIASGTCGDNLTWTLTGTGTDMTLTIGGTGEMYDYFGYSDTFPAPWREYGSSIKNIVLNQGITSIGPGSLGCCAITNITIPEGVTYIGWSAFDGCKSLTSVKMPDSLITIDGFAFNGCTNLSNITIPDSVTKINSSAFYGCSSLTSISIPDGVTSIGWSAFQDCTSLTSVTIPASVTTIDYHAFDGCDNAVFYVYENSYAHSYVNLYFSSRYELICIHDYGNWTITKKATCTTEGTQTKACAKCGDTITETIPALGHDWNSEPTVDKAATCTEDGSQSIHCSRCDEIKDAEVIPAVGHTFNDWNTTKEATEIAEGQQSRVCSVCGETETQIIAQLKPTLPKVTISKPKAEKKAATVKWKKVSKKNLKKISKIQIQYSTSKDFSTKVGTKYASAKKTSYKIKSLKKGKKYYIRIRAYKKSGGKVHVSKWSSVRYVKVK